MTVFSYKRLACQAAVVTGFTFLVVALLAIYKPGTLTILLAKLHGESLAPPSVFTGNSEAQIRFLTLGFTLFLVGHVPLFRFILVKVKIKREIRNWLES